MDILNRHRSREAGPQGTSVDLLAQQHRLASAATLARRGLYQQAEDLLATIAEGPLACATLDLRAKILAQQGRFLEAERCWMEALSRSPGTASYRAALEHLAGTRVARIHLSWVAGLAAVLVVLIVIPQYVDNKVREALSVPNALAAHQQELTDNLAKQCAGISQGLNRLRDELKAALEAGKRERQELAGSFEASLKRLAASVETQTQQSREQGKAENAAIVAAIAESEQSIAKLGRDLSGLLRSGNVVIQGLPQQLADQDARLGGQLGKLNASIDVFARRLDRIENAVGQLRVHPQSAPASQRSGATRPG